MTKKREIYMSCKISQIERKVRENERKRHFFFRFPLLLGSAGTFRLFALGLHITVDEVNLMAVGAHNQRGSVAKLHRGRLRLVERRPIWQTLGIGIARLGEVYPVLLQYFGHSSLVGIFVGLAEEGVVQIHDVVGMGHAAAALVL